jgi:hypothetical protein
MSNEPGTDAATVDEWMGKLPANLRIALGPALRGFVEAIIQHERARCVAVLKVGGRYHRSKVAEAESAIAAGIAQGASVAELAVARASQIACIQAMETAARAVGASPGACTKCGGWRLVPAAIVLAGGQKPLVPCQACAVTPPVNGTNGAIVTPIRPAAT